MDFVMTAVIAALFGCEMCDALEAGTAKHPFAISASWTPKCEGARERFLAADPWPEAGETRSDSFTRACADVALTRAFLAAPGGLSEGELYVAASMQRTRGRDVAETRSHEFIGAAGSLSYRYSFTLDAEGAIARATGIVEATRVTSHLVGTALAPQARPKTLGIQAVTCEAWLKRCELMSRPKGSDVALPYFAVRFDANSPEGELCVAGAENADSVTLEADGVSIAEGIDRTAATGPKVCLGERSKAALDAMSKAGRLTYRVTRQAGDERVDLDPTGFAVAVELGRFLFKSAVAKADRPAAERRLRIAADAMLDAAPKTN